MMSSLTTDDPSRALNELPDHSGQPRAKEAEFFAAPPAEIGTVLSAESTLRPGRKAMPLYLRILIGVIVAGAIVYGGHWLAEGANQMDKDIIRVLARVFAFIAFGAVLLATHFKAVCSYVGDKGMVIYTRHGQRTGKPKTLLFEQAQELRAKQTRNYVNGIYTGTTYDFTWTGPEKKRVYRATGSYLQRKKGLRPGEPFRLLQAAEFAWSDFFLERANEVLKTEGSVPFRIDKRRVVRVGPGFMEFHFGDKPLRLTHEEIASVTLGGGVFQFRHKDAKWYSLSGKYSFEYGNMANARVFLLALESLMGYTWN